MNCWKAGREKSFFYRCLSSRLCLCLPPLFHESNGKKREIGWDKEREGGVAKRKEIGFFFDWFCSRSCCLSLSGLYDVALPLSASVRQPVTINSTHMQCVVLSSLLVPPVLLFKKKRVGKLQTTPAQLTFSLWQCEAILLLAVQLATPCDLQPNWQVDR